MSEFKTFLLEYITEEDQTIDQEIITNFASLEGSDEKFPISIDKLVEWGFDAHRSAAVCRLEKNYSLDIDFKRNALKSTGGRPKIEIMLSIDCFKAMCAQAQNEKGKMVLKYFWLVEKLWKRFMDEQMKAIEEELNSKNEIIINKDKKLLSIMKRHKSIDAQLGDRRTGFYIISDCYQEFCSGNCKRPKRYKVGIDEVNVARRLDQHRTDIPSLKVEFLVYLDKFDCRLLEESVLRRYEKKRFPYLNHEWIYNIPVEEIIETANHLLEFANMKHEVADIEKINNINNETRYKIQLGQDHLSKINDTLPDLPKELQDKDIASVDLNIKIHDHTIKTPQIKHKEDQLIIQAQFHEIQRKMDELVTINNEMTSYDVKKIRETLLYFELNHAGPKLEIFKRLKEYINAQKKSLLLQVPDTRPPEPEKEPEQLKQCSKCEKVLPVSRFYISSRAADGYRHRCKTCFDVRVMGTGKCAECETEISKRATHCKSCNAKRTSNRQCPNKPSREVFMEMIKVHTQKEIAKIVGVGKDTVMKWKKEWSL